MRQNLAAYRAIGAELNRVYYLALLAEAYQKIDLSGSYNLGHRLTFYTTIEDLANERYSEAFGFPALPLIFRTGMKIRLGGESWK